MTTYLFRLRLQDPTVDGFSVWNFRVPSDYVLIPDGLERDAFQIMPSLGVRSPKGQYFSDARTRAPIADFSFEEKSLEFDMVQTFVVTDRVIAGFSRLYTAVTGKSFPANRYGKKLRIYPHSNDFKDAPRNAVYTFKDEHGRIQHTIQFGFYEEQDGRRVDIVDSADVVAHELGHALLSLAKPEFWKSTHSETRAIHESFGDLCAVAFLIEFPALAEKILQDTGGDLRRSSYLSIIGEQLGNGRGIRDLNNDVTMRTSGRKAHALSRVLSGAIYSLLTMLFTREVRLVEEYQQTHRALLEAHRTERAWFACFADPAASIRLEAACGECCNSMLPEVRDLVRARNIAKADILKAVASNIAKRVLAAIMAAPQNAQFSHISEHILGSETNPSRRALITACFERREIPLQSPETIARETAARGRAAIAALLAARERTGHGAPFAFGGGTRVAAALGQGVAPLSRDAAAQRTFRPVF